MASPRPARILFVENGIGFGGAVICLRYLVRSLDRARFEPIVTTAHSDGPYRALAEDACWIPISDRVMDLAPARQWISHSPWLTRWPRVRIALQRTLGRLDDAINLIPYVFRLWYRMRRLGPAVVHVNNEPLCNRAALLAARMARVPVVCHVRGDVLDTFLLRRLFRLPKVVVPVSAWIERRVLQLGVSARQVRMIYDGIDLDRLDRDASGVAFRQRHGIAQDVFLIGLVGMLIPWKGQRLFLDAIEQLAAAHPLLHFALIGGTPKEYADYEREIRSLIDAKDLANRVTLTGHVAEMSSAYNGLDVVVTASVDPEPLGIVMVEALALGRPLVAPAHGGTLEIVEDETTGLLFRPNDPQSLANALLRLYQNPGLRAKLGAAAAAQVRTQFSIARSVQAVEEIYEDLLSATER